MENSINNTNYTPFKNGILTTGLAHSIPYGKRESILHISITLLDGI